MGIGRDERVRSKDHRGESFHQPLLALKTRGYKSLLNRRFIEDGKGDRLTLELPERKETNHHPAFSPEIYRDF